MRPKAIVVDLDDTLYPQSQYLRGATAALAARAGALGLAPAEFAGAYAAVLSQGSDAGRTIDRAIERLGVEAARASALVPLLAGEFARFRPSGLCCYEGARDGLARMRTVVPVALLTDGGPEIQRSKLAALGLEHGFDLVVITDEACGRERRKPHPAGLWPISERFGIEPRDLLVIGDRVDKDVEAARRGGASAIRVRTGEHAGGPTPPCIPEAASFAEAARMVQDRFLPARP
jgi:putative hydrolase of the HAD superfamily